MIERKKYHQSELHCFLKCGKMWEFRYERKLRIPPRAALTVGSSVDRSVSTWAMKMIQGLQPTKAEILQVVSDEFDKRITETVLDEEEKAGDLKDQAVSLASLHFEQVAPTFRPATVQEEFVLEMDTYDLGGTIDLVDTDDIVRDTKTSSRVRAGSYEVNRSFQPAMYDFAFEAIRGRRAKGFVFDVLKKPTAKIGPEYLKTEGQVTDLDRDWLFDSIDMVHKAINAGISLPAPEGSWYCSEKWCGYHSICKGRK